MFYSAGTIFWAFVAMFGGMFVFEPVARRGYGAASKAIVALMLVAALYLLASGVHMAIDWQDPFAGKDPAEMARSVHSPKGWAFVWLLRIWPYVQIAFSGLYALAAFRILTGQRRARV